MFVVIFFLVLSCPLFSQDQFDELLQHHVGEIEQLWRYFQILKYNLKKDVPIESWREQYGEVDVSMLKNLIRIYFSLRACNFCPHACCEQEGCQNDVFLIFFVWGENPRYFWSPKVIAFCCSLEKKWQTVDDLTENLMKLFSRFQSQ